jgi:hypothetical protein
MEQLRSAARGEISSRDVQQQDPPVFERLSEISVSRRCWSATRTIRR